VAPSSLRRQFDLLRRAASFRLLFFATLASGIGTWLAAIALTINVYDLTGSASWVSGLLIADFLPTVAIGLFLGSLVDRLQRKRLMIGADLLRLGVFAALPFTSSPTAIVVLAGVTGVANGFFRPAVYAGLPNLVDDADLSDANSLFQTADNVTWGLGPLIGGALVGISGPHLAYWVNAVTFGVSALLLSRIPYRALQSAQALSRGHFHDLADGLRTVLRSPALLAVLVAWSIAMFGNAAINVSEVVLATVTFNAGAFGFGFLAAAAGIALAIGSLLAPGQVERFGIARVYAVGIALMALGALGAALSPNVWVASALVLVFGAGNGAGGVCNALLVQRGAPDVFRGRVFTLIMSVNYVFLGLGMAIAGPLTNNFGARWVWAVAAALYAVSALVGYVLVRRAKGVDDTVVEVAADAGA
jgi:MFS family permease